MLLETCWDLPPPASYLVISIVKVEMGQINIHSELKMSLDKIGDQAQGMRIRQEIEQKEVGMIAEELSHYFQNCTIGWN